MSTPGWYPDPGGRSGHFRFWDGRTWSPTTVTELPGVPGPSRSRPPRRRRGILIGVGALLVVVLVAAAALVLRPTGRPADLPAPASATAPSVDGGPATSEPVPSDGSTLATPASPSAPTPSRAPCPVGEPLNRQDHPDDDRVHGGGLSFPRQTGWYFPGRQASDFTWAYDVGETDLQVEQNWYASYAVGALSVADGFEDPQSAAELVLECTVASDLYRNVTSRTDLVDEAATVDGYPAWQIRTEIRADDPRTSFDGDTVQVTVVDYGAGEALGFFWGCAPLGASAFTQRLDIVAAQLAVD